MKSLWWMQERTASGCQRPNPELDRGYASWPWNSARETSALFLRELWEHMQEYRSSKCTVDRYIGVPGSGGHAPYWRWESKAESHAALQTLLARDQPICSEAQGGDIPPSTFYLVRQPSSQGTQLLGYYLKLPPRFFNPSFVVYDVSPKSERSFLYFKLQFIEIEAETTCYGHGDSSGPPVAFKGKSQWRFTDVALICATGQQPQNFDAVCTLNPEDDTIAEALHRLVSMAGEGQARSSVSSLMLMFKLVNEVFRIIALNWGFFLDDAEAHLAGISSKCLGRRKLSTEDQLRFTRELHQLTPVWSQVSRRLSAARNVIDVMREHPFYTDAANPEEASEFLLKIRSTIDEHQGRTQALREQTSTLTSLVLNIAMLNESTGTMQEAQASTNLAVKVHRITIITFIFFPLSLSMVRVPALLFLGFSCF